MKGQPRRDWTAAREKCEDGCRIGRRCEGPIEAAHIVGRDRDRFTLSGEPHGRSVWPVEPLRIVPLCRKHHGEFDRHERDILGFLNAEEQAQACLDAGGLELARVRLAPLAYERAVA